MKKKNRVQSYSRRTLFIVLSLFVLLLMGAGYSIIGNNLLVNGNVNVDKYDKTLYGVFEKSYKKGSDFVREYEGEHIDSFTQTGNKKIYYWYPPQSASPSYVLNHNNVLFAGYCWQMIRTTDTGGVKLLYNGVPTNRRCDNTGTGQQIGTSIFNNHDDAASYVGYMYHESYPSLYTLYGSNLVYYDSIVITNQQWYANSVSWNETTGAWELVDPFQYSSVSSSNDIIGTYTFGSSDVSYSADTVKYVVGLHTSSRFYFISLTNGNTLSSSIDYYTYGDSVTENMDETYTINSPSTMSAVDYFTGYSSLKNKYVCVNAIDNTCSGVLYVFSAYNNYFNYHSSDQMFTIGETYTYDPEMGVYRLSGDVQSIWNVDDTDSQNMVNTHHYTCFNTSGECSDISYIISFFRNRFYYVVISNGEGGPEALSQMLYADDVNTNDSVIKTYIENWYANNLSDYSEYLEDFVFCNNRSQENADVNSWNPNGGQILKDLSFLSSRNDLSCPNVTDQFSVNNPQARLTYPIGLPTAPEIQISNSKGLYQNGANYWTGTPSNYNAHYNVIGSVMNAVSSSGYTTFYNSKATSSIGVRPVVSLKPGTIYYDGDGSKNNPYDVEPPI